MVMETYFLLLTILQALVSLPVFLKPCKAASDTLTPTQSLTEGKTLVSSGKTFELGFFSPGKSNNRYIGIWYKRSPEVVVWVANRNNPLTDSYGASLSLNTNGNLVLLNRTSTIIWSSNTSIMVLHNPVAQLLDSGNFVVRDKNSSMNPEMFAWQSFDYPTDTLLEGQKFGWDLNKGLERYLTSWKSPDDPSTGDFTYRMNETGIPQFIISRGQTRVFRTGTWNGIRFSGFATLTDTIFRSIIVINDREKYFMFVPNTRSTTTRLTMNYSGLALPYMLKNNNTEWNVIYSDAYDLPCDGYEFCGANAICKTNTMTVCECLQGFTPKFQQEWEAQNWKNGCVRKIDLDCNSEEGFVQIEGVKLPDLLEFWLDKYMNIQECKKACLKNCSCTAYANSDVRGKGSGCLMWFGDLIDVRYFNVEGSEDTIHIRLAASEIKSIMGKNAKKNVRTILVAISAVCFFCLLLCCIIAKIRTGLSGTEKEDIELPLFHLATVASATNNFSPEYRIGAGGFGHVYKGKLSTGQEIAVKRLSNDSGQGLKEFKNEIELIAKLQHRNLVALLGCCIQGEEKMLIYEYMPNKSLDHFIFDNERRTILCWEKQFNIIMGIARGLLYLHRDSKLQIIHRDLKAGNVLLDHNFKPKISDFGLARIFKEDEKEARTKRIVGTYGYMSPEYAVDGKLSVKSDVFSFGVLLLEIVSGKKNSKFIHPDHHHRLLGHAWLLWNEERALDLVDESMNVLSSCIECQVLRCIQVGLLCVQKFAKDRPTMSSVIFMLENETAILPQPKQPGFFIERTSNDDGLASRNEECGSQNAVTITLLHGR
ncbi:G-type lectin S-receptor-like serine/threonine-protein kinase At4g27290 [Ziziphus jujuba]|uniref:Receptor-like serine/threonine-protein kinase n=1 Tax=Ziziphus jujuba TaxID=326968 RepID=A0A6P3Z7F3_ZIZJJ|nr:G-type lectin S-receptor-like serine/threonine-protein kinase At4g27290 [Ziziphus jujuba]